MSITKSAYLHIFIILSSLLPNLIKYPVVNIQVRFCIIIQTTFQNILISSCLVACFLFEAELHDVRSQRDVGNEVKNEVMKTNNGYSFPVNMKE